MFVFPHFDFIVTGDFNQIGALTLVDLLTHNGFSHSDPELLATHDRSNVLDFIFLTGKINKWSLSYNELFDHTTLQARLVFYPKSHKLPRELRPSDFRSI